MVGRSFVFSDRLAAEIAILPDSLKLDAIRFIMEYGLDRCKNGDGSEFEKLADIIDSDNKKAIKVSSEDISYIIGTLNKICDTNYRASSVNTKKLINARYNEGFSREDFVKVIKSKHREWQGTKFERYLCPETLFGTKFEKYLNGKSEDDLAPSSFDTSDYFDAALSRAYGEDYAKVK